MVRLLVKKESWPRFITKAMIVLLVIILIGYSFSTRFKIGMDTQIVKCIPGYTFYLIDKKDKSLKKDSIYSFESKGLDPFYEDGTQMVKYLRAEPNDLVEITPLGIIKINNTDIGFRGFPHAPVLNKEISDFVGKGTLKSGEYWFMGTDFRSFDSRYWGTVKYEQIIGRAYPLF